MTGSVRKHLAAFATAATLLISASAEGRELPVFYRGIRPAGMGGAFTAVADDENALFYNPAGLNSIEGFGGVDVFNPLFEIGNNTVTFLRRLSDLANAGSDTEQARIAQKLLEDFLGEHVHLRTALFPNLTMHNFGIGILGQAVLDGEVHHPLGINTLDVTGGYDVALVAGGAYRLTVWNGPLQVGLTGKVIRRSLVDQRYTVRELVQLDGVDPAKDLQVGAGFGLDLGAIYTLPAPFDPAVALVIQNVGKTHLGDAGDLDQQINAGLALHPPVPLGKAVVAFDFVDLARTAGTDRDTAKRLHLGAEYRFPAIVSVRAGFNQGYFVAGMTADFAVVRLAYAYTVEEVGAYAGQTPDRRHMVQLSLGF
jgi:hypothetical protein